MRFHKSTNNPQAGAYPQAPPDRPWQAAYGGHHRRMTSPAPTLRLTSPADIIAAVPYLIGFHPTDSLVAMGFAGSSLRVTTRWDLPSEPGILGGLLPVLRRDNAKAVILIGYGPGPLVTPAIDDALPLLRENGVEVAEAFRVHENRYWSYVCRRITCCPPEGGRYDPAASPIAAEAVVR